ncbi:MAG: hypothetical protein M1836_002050 [Candelina mexicana]|nr:MAG: hypothetical protein M1836_002050 [Candelina mexicana]
MFQRLKGAIDSRIAEEQARQKASSSSPSRSNSTARRASARTESPSKRQGRTRDREKGDRSLTKGPDPSEFDAEIVVDDEATESPNGDHAQEKAGPRDSGSNEAGQQVSPLEGQDGETRADSGERKPAIASLELPTDVRVKLRKLDKLESRYQELLRSYRIAHARVSSIEPFEASLRENTPLTSIGDPSALVEYLNQMNLKSGMVMEELKRVSSEKDAFKQRFGDAEKRTNEAMEEVAKLRKEKAEADTSRRSSVQLDNSQSETQDFKVNEDKIEPVAESHISPSTTSIKSPIRALFSPKQSIEDNKEVTQESEDFFSYDTELPRVESELRQRETEVKLLRGDLAVARESTESMVQSLEQATRELHGLRDGKERYEANMNEQHASMEKATNQLRTQLQQAEEELASLRSQQTQEQIPDPEQSENKLEAAEAEIEHLKSEHSIQHEITDARDRLQEDVLRLKASMSEMEVAKTQTDKRTETLNGLVTNLRSQLYRAEKAQEQLLSEIREKEYSVAESNTTVSRLREELRIANQHHLEAERNSNPVNGEKSITAIAETLRNVNSGAGAKKKNKNKKGGKGSAPLSGQLGPVAAEAINGDDLMRVPSSDANPSDASRNIEAKLQQELETLRHLLEDKDASIDRLRKEIRNGEDMQEEIEGLRDELLNHGDEHVEAEKKVKELQTEKVTLETSVKSLVLEIKELRNSNATSTEDSEKLRGELSRELESLKLKAATLQTDLSAAEQLAASRFKDLTDLRGILQRAQPELTSLRSEVTNLKTANNDLKGKAAALERLEAEEKNLRSEILSLRQEVAERDAEIKTLRDKVGQETSSRMQAEDRHNDAQNDLARILVEKKNATESRDKAAKDLAKAQEELRVTRGRLQELEQQAAKLNRDADTLREEAELKTAQYASAQSLMSSMRDQTNEIGMQMKEARDRCESLEEELGDSHRLLSERSREGETMRRLLADVESRSESKIRDMKERMEVAIEERDRAEDEANTIGRRRAREIEELKGKVRDAERSLKRAEDDKEELERGERDWRRRREELDERAEQSGQEVREVRQAMGELRDALDESEKQARDLEKQKVELRRSIEETQHRLEKLQKSNKSMSDELRSVQMAKARALDSDVMSSRSSFESSPSRAAITSPQPKNRGPSTPTSEAPTGPAGPSIDYVYLKNVLLQFLEQRDKKHQMQLIPVLGMLLHFDR